jgi:hypothetical protein
MVKQDLLKAVKLAHIALLLQGKFFIVQGLWHQ